MSAPCTWTPTRSPLVSVMMRRLRPLTFLPASYPRGPPLSVDLTDGLSITPPEGLASRPRPLAGLRGLCQLFAPVDRRRFGHPASRSGRLQDAERYRGSAHVLPTASCR